MNKRNAQKELFIKFQLKRIYSKITFQCLIKRKILSGNFYNSIEKSFDSHALKLISMKLSFGERQLEFMSE